MADQQSDGPLEGAIERLLRAREELDRVDRMLERGEEPEDVRESVGNVREATDRAVQAIRGVVGSDAGSESSGTSPASRVEDLGEANRWLAVEVDEAVAGAFSEETVELVGEAARALYASSEASGVTMEVGRGAGRVECVVEEELDEEMRPRPGRSIEGLRPLRERVRELGGDLRVESSWAEGTRIEISLDIGGDEAG